jgi:hypothetical protein
MGESLKYLEGMKKEKATPMRRKTRRAEGSQKDFNLKIDLSGLKESRTLFLVKMW